MGRTVKDLALDEARARQLQLALRERIHMIEHHLKSRVADRDYWGEQLAEAQHVLRDLVSDWGDFF
jgi:hypothetical protein